MTTISTTYQAPYTLTRYNITTRADWEESYRRIRMLGYRQDKLSYILYRGLEYHCFGYGAGVDSANNAPYNPRKHRLLIAEMATIARRDKLRKMGRL